MPHITRKWTTTPSANLLLGHLGHTRQHLVTRLGFGYYFDA